MKICRVDGCAGNNYRRMLCRTHYIRWRKYGDPEGGGTFRGAPTQWINDHKNYVGDECLIWPFSRNAQGYAKIGDGRGGHKFVHGVMLELTVGPCPDGYVTRHLCGKGHEGCVHPLHLAYGTQKQNVHDQLSHGTEIRGQRNGNSKLKDEQVLDIRVRLSNGEKQKELSKEYGVSQVCICNIKNGKRWKHLPVINGSEEVALFKKLSGSKNYTATLTVHQVREIKLKLKDRFSQASLSREYGVSHGAIQAIKEGKSWGWLDQEA